MKLPFVKMHGTGNDFVVIDARERQLPQLETMARQLCDRRFGVGADQLLLVQRAPDGVDADFRMAIFNADGSEVEMCGNGIRCFAKYVRDHGMTEKDVLRVHTDAGIIVPRLEAGGEVTVDMGEPILDGERIPTTFTGRVVRQPLAVGDRTFEVTCVSMGNPHCVVEVDDVDSFRVEHYGPLSERHETFPRRINTEYVQVLQRDVIKMRVWERGSGETLACGTGACASVVAMSLEEKVDRRAEVRLRGGILRIEWREEDNRVYMTGPAAEVFTGEIALDAGAASA